MKYYTSAQAAEKLINTQTGKYGVTKRAVNKIVRKLEGTIKPGHDWLIPIKTIEKENERRIDKYRIDITT